MSYNNPNMTLSLKTKKKVYVAMSGGVDSSVAAALLKKQGFNVTGVFFKPWSPSALVSYCNWQQDRADAMRVATILEIPFKTWDFSDVYGKKVVKYMVSSYHRGQTPNPDVMCNKEIKFGLFLKKALTEGADYIATGHYARIQKLTYKTKYELLKAKDQNKDQTYFLWMLKQTQLSRCLFPIGNYAKPEVRKLAKKFNLPNYAKKDSQGVCFVGELNMKDFLMSYIKPKTGDIKLIESDKTIGNHDGVYYYTIGQRHGLNIKLGHGPYYVVVKNFTRNIIYVTQKEAVLSSKTAKMKEISWTGEGMQLPLKAMVKIRYRNHAMSAKIAPSNSSGVLNIKFNKPARAVTPGQSAVIYQGQVVLGGGVII